MKIIITTAPHVTINSTDGKALCALVDSLMIISSHEGEQINTIQSIDVEST